MKDLKKMKGLALVLTGLTLAGLVMTADAADMAGKSGKDGAVHQISSTPWEGEEHLKMTNKWDKTFPESDKVDHTKVIFHNRYGITLAADLYMPKKQTGQNAGSGSSRPVWCSKGTGRWTVCTETGRNGIYYHGF